MVLKRSGFLVHLIVIERTIFCAAFLFRFDNGTPLTGTRMNRLIDQLLNPYVDRNIGKFNSHSFRIGLASLLANAGLPDDELQAIGRWSSRAFEVYLKLKRTKRMSVGRKVTELIR